MNFIGTNRKGETKLYFLPIVQNNIVHQENEKILDKILVSLFYYFVNPFPAKINSERKCSDWFIWLINWLQYRWIGRLIDWMIDLEACLVPRFCWLINWLQDRWIGRLIDWMIDLEACLVPCFCWLISWLLDRWIGGLIDRFRSLLG